MFFTENSPELELLSEKGLLAKVAPATLASVPAADSGSNGDWVGVLARENVLAYNKGMVKEEELPASLLDLAKPEWKGKVAIAPTDADFLPLVGAVVALKGRQAALEWLKGLRENAAIFDDDEGVTAAVERGAAATGIINNYYWARLSMETGPDKMKSAIHHFAGGDVGGLMNVSGAAVLKSFAQSGRGPEVSGLPGEQAGAGDGVASRHHLRISPGAGRRREPGAEAHERTVAAVDHAQGDRRRSRRGAIAARSRPYLMSSDRERDRGDRRERRVSRPPRPAAGRACRGRGRRRRARLAADPLHDRSGERGRWPGRRRLSWFVRSSARSWSTRFRSSSQRRWRPRSSVSRPPGSSSARTFPAGKSGPCLWRAPLAVPPFITSYAWVSISNTLQDFAGALLVVTFAYFPLVYLPVAAALRGLDPALEETARSLGEGAWGCFLRVVLPQLRPALFGGVLLVALDALTEFGAFALLRFRTFTTELYAQYRIELDGPETSLLALVLVALCLALLVAELRVRGRARYARVGGGSETRQRAGRPWPVALAGSFLLWRARRRDARRPDRA